MALQFTAPILYAVQEAIQDFYYCSIYKLNKNPWKKDQKEKIGYADVPKLFFSIYFTEANTLARVMLNDLIEDRMGNQDFTVAFTKTDTKLKERLTYLQRISEAYKEEYQRLVTLTGKSRRMSVSKLFWNDLFKIDEDQSDFRRLVMVRRFSGLMATEDVRKRLYNQLLDIEKSYNEHDFNRIAEIILAK